MSGDSTLTREQVWIDYFNRIIDLAVEWASYIDVEGLLYSLVVIVALFGFGLIVGFIFGIEKGRWIEIDKQIKSFKEIIDEEDVHEDRTVLQDLYRMDREVGPNEHLIDILEEETDESREDITGDELEVVGYEYSDESSNNDVERVQEVFGVDEQTAKKMLSESVDVDRSGETATEEAVDILDEETDTPREELENSNSYVEDIEIDEAVAEDVAKATGQDVDELRDAEVEIDDVEDTGGDDEARSEDEIRELVSDKLEFTPDPEYIFVYKCEDCEKEVAQYLSDPHWAGHMFCVCGGIMRFDKIENLDLLRNTVDGGDDDD